MQGQTTGTICTQWGCTGSKNVVVVCLLVDRQVQEEVVTSTLEDAPLSMEKSDVKGARALRAPFVLSGSKVWVTQLSMLPVRSEQP